MSSIVFFIGILLAVASLEHAGLLRCSGGLAGRDDRPPGRHRGRARPAQRHHRQRAAGRGDHGHVRPGHYPTDSFLWEFIAYCAGTGGSILIIGSAAGVAAMGLERIEFLWYARRIAIPALAGYLAGAVVYVAQHAALH